MRRSEVAKFRLTRINYAGAAAIAAAASIAIIVRFAESERRVPARCPPGLESMEARCCGLGQGLSATGQCVGAASACAVDMSRDDAGACVLAEGRAHFAGGTTHLAGAEWDGPSELPREIRVAPFDLDRGEVTVARFRACSLAGSCPKVSDDSEPGRPVRNISSTEASAFCQYAGGRLPTSDEWIFAAVGPSGRRYPWGSTGLVCRRASFGLVNGPCARAGLGPDLAGARPDGKSPEGVFDLVGNVAEWTLQPDGSFVARGGSYRSEVAGDLKGWSVEAGVRRAPHVGLRCAYDVVAPSPG